METLVVVDQHKNQYYGRVKPNSYGYGSPPSKSFRGINCRTFQSSPGILPTPFNSLASPVTKQSRYLSSPRTPSPAVKFQSNDKTPLKFSGRSSSVPITIKHPNNERSFYGNNNMSFSELWAGPAYSNSPPPSSLPIPKFSLRSKRTVSLELPSSGPGIKIHAIAKSAPASPTREHGSPNRDVFATADFATQTLRRILNLDNA
ncbi:hypothetical protein ACFE04_031558 [Oxalis oulophora]